MEWVRSHHILILSAPDEGDGLIQLELSKSGYNSKSASVSEICRSLSDHQVDVIILRHEHVDNQALSQIENALAHQDVWSDCPILLIASADQFLVALKDVSPALGNVTVVESPISSDALSSYVSAAIRARHQQRRAQKFLEQRERAEGAARELAAELESRVVTRTRQLQVALDRKDATERRLKESEELHRLVVELSRQTPWSADGLGSVLSIGTAWERQTGRSRQDALDHRWQNAVYELDRERVVTQWQKSLSSRTPFDSEHRFVTAEGEAKWFRVRAAPMLSYGEVTHWYGTMEEVHEAYEARLQLEDLSDAFAKAARANAMGAMGSAMAHEINQPLTAISQFARGLRNEATANPHTTLADVVPILAEIDEASLRTGEIVRRLRELITKGNTKRTVIRATVLFEQVFKLLSNDIQQARVQMTTSVTDDPLISLDLVQIQQVLINLIRNSIDAMTDSPVKKIVLAAERCHDTRFLKIEVRDIGPGIDPRIANNLYTPFFSTKPEGMGLGLSISRTVVEAHGGTIWQRADDPTGCVFGFTLQVAPG